MTPLGLIEEAGYIGVVDTEQEVAGTVEQGVAVDIAVGQQGAAGMVELEPADIGQGRVAAGRFPLGVPQACRLWQEHQPVRLCGDGEGR